LSPPRSPTIVGSAVETIVWSSEAEQQDEQQRREDQPHPPLTRAQLNRASERRLS
jgi:hypothetical protein